MNHVKTLKKLLAIFFAVVMVATLLPLKVIASTLPYDESTYTLTGNPRADIVGIAKTQIGYCEGKNQRQLDGTVVGHNNYTKFATYSQMNGEPWCAMFVVWCARKAGITSASGILDSTVRAAAAPGDPSNYSFHFSIYSANIYTPQPGDMIFFNTDYTRTTNPATRSTWIGTNNVYAHVGIVEKVEGSLVYTIEGNINDKVVNNSYDLSDSSIMGYGVPTGFSTTPVVSPTMALDKTTYTVGETINITYTGAKSAKDWFGIVEKGKIPSTSVPSLKWAYLVDGTLNPVNGTCSINASSQGTLSVGTNLPAGTYTAYFCINDGYEYYVTQDFTITN